MHSNMTCNALIVQVIKMIKKGIIVIIITLIIATIMAVIIRITTRIIIIGLMTFYNYNEDFLKLNLYC